MPELLDMLREQGLLSDDLSPAQLEEVSELLGRIGGDVNTAVVEVLRARRQADAAKEQCENAAGAAGELEKILSGLLEASAMLGRLDRLEREARGAPQAICRVGGQLRAVPVHPDVNLDELEALEPWEYVYVHAKEMVLIGICRYPGLFARSQGAVVEFKGYYDRDQGLVRVAHHGQEDQIVELVPELREQELSPPVHLVLLRDDERWAIAQLPADRPESRFEVPINQIETRLDDLAGMDAIVQPLVEDILLRLVHPEIRQQFDLRPLKGMLLYSYKPGMGKTALMRAVALWLSELGADMGFDVVLYVVKPNELKSVWHGGDAKLVREDLCGSIAARQRQPRERALFQIVVLDEIDSLGKRSGGDEGGIASSAQNDAVQSLLVEIDGMIGQQNQGDNPPAHVLWVGLTNRPDMLDEAMKRPGRFGDWVNEVPDLSAAGAEAIMAVYARQAELPWELDGNVVTGIECDTICSRFLRPALAQVFPAVVLRYKTEHQENRDVTAGDALAGVHYMDAMNCAKKKAATRRLLSTGVPAVTLDDVVDGLVEQASSVARQMEADRMMLVRQLRIKVPVTRIEAVAAEELSLHHYVRVHAAS